MMQDTAPRIEKWFRTPQEDFDDKRIVFERSKKHWDEIQNSFPIAGNGFKIMADDLGQTLIRCFVYCPENISEKDTRMITRWMKNYFGNVERNFRKEEGRFYWLSRREQIKDEHGNYDFLFFIENTHPLTCEIKKVVKEVEVFESVCK